MALAVLPDYMTPMIKKDYARYHASGLILSSGPVEARRQDLLQAPAIAPPGRDPRRHPGGGEGDRGAAGGDHRWVVQRGAVIERSPLHGQVSSPHYTQSLARPW